MQQKTLSRRKSDCVAFFNKLLFDNDGKNELCHLCLVIVDDPIRHVRQVHLNLPLFQCPCCSFYSTWNEMEVAIHLTVAHDDPPHRIPLDNSSLYAASLQDWMNKCYGWTDSQVAVATNPLSAYSNDPTIETSPSMEAVRGVKRPQVVVGSDSALFRRSSRLRHWELEEEVRNGGEWEKIRSGVKQVERVEKISKNVEGGRSRGRPASTNSRPASINTNARTNSFSCRLCNITRSCYRTALVHLYRTHLNIPTLFGCRLCAFTHSCDRVVAQRHAINEHRTKSALTSREDEFKDVIEFLKVRCFGDAKEGVDSGRKSTAASRDDDAVRAMFDVRRDDNAIYDIRREVRVESTKAYFFRERRAPGALSPPGISRKEKKAVERARGRIDRRVAQQTFIARPTSNSSKLLFHLPSSPSSPPSLPSTEGSPGRLTHLSPPNLPAFSFNSTMKNTDHEIENEMGLNQVHQTFSRQHAAAHKYREPIGV